MNEILTHLPELIKKQISQTDFEVTSIIPVPGSEEKKDTSDTIEYLLKIKQKNKPEVTPSPKAQTESIYLANGKLNIPYLFKNAELLFDSTQYPLARNIYQAILKSGGYTALTLYRLARCYEAEGKLEEAQKSYEESITFGPSLDAYQRLASLLVRENKDLKAAEIMERALHLKELPQRTQFELHKACGNSWTRAKQKDNAEKHYKAALDLEPTADEIRSNLGTLYLQNNQVSEAKRHFQDAIASNPRNHLALSGLGSCALGEGNKIEAHDYFAQSLGIELNNPASVFYLVKCAYEIKSYAVAAQTLAEYIQIAPVNTNLLYSLAGLQFHLGRIPEAKTTTHRILELQAEHSGAKELLGLIQKYSDN